MRFKVFVKRGKWISAYFYVEADTEKYVSWSGWEIEHTPSNFVQMSTDFQGFKCKIFNLIKTQLYQLFKLI